MRLDDEPESTNYEVQRGGGGMPGFGGGGGGLMGLLLPMIASRFGCTGVIIAVVLMGIFSFTNISSTIAPGGGTESGMPAGQGGSAAEEAGGQAGTPGQPGAANALSDIQRFSLRVLGSTERVWGQVFREHGQRYEPTVLSFYAQSGRSGCGAAQSAMGPFYCPLDKKIYLDTDFFTELRQRFGAPGDFAQAYVIAHEVGHHIQDLEGTLGKVNQAQRSAGEAQANAMQVRVELQADCYAGVWGKLTGLMEPGDVEEGMKAAEAIGDDTLQRQAGQRPMPDSFTHGSSEQRMSWLRRGLESGDPQSCDTFQGR